MNRLYIRDFWYWWRGIYFDWASHKWPTKKSGKSNLIVCVTASGVTLWHADISSVRDASEIFADTELRQRIAGLLAENPGNRQWRCTIRLAPGRFILRHLSRYLLPASQLALAAELDFETSTPFARHDMKVLPIATANRSSAYAIVKNAILEPIIDGIRANGCAISALEFETESGLARLANYASDVSLRSVGRWQRRAALICATSLLVGFGGTIVHAYSRNQSAIALLQGDLDRLAADAKIARQALDSRAKTLGQINVLRKSIEDNEPASGVWEELARVLPDSAYLTDLTIKGSQVSIAGFGEDAAGLVVALEQSPLFSQATFNGPVTRVPGMDGEHFEANFSVGPD